MQCPTFFLLEGVGGVGNYFGEPSLDEGKAATKRALGSLCLKISSVMYREKDSELTAQQHVDKVYEKGDANHDGQLSLDEFLAICKSNPKLSCILQSAQNRFRIARSILFFLLINTRVLVL